MELKFKIEGSYITNLARDRFFSDNKPAEAIELLLGCLRMIYPKTRDRVLLHNPFQGIAEVKCDPVRRLTDAQKEFLYDYYIERNEHKKANAIYE